MATLPDTAMRDAATRVIEFIGEPMDFQRKDDGGSWGISATGVTVHAHPQSSELDLPPSTVPIFKLD
jgi:hypothetical protein